MSSTAQSKLPAIVTLTQLGGRSRLEVMCGAKNFMSRDDGNTLTFRVPVTLTRNRINYVAVKYLPGTDLYDLEFGSIRGLTYKVVAERKGVYASELSNTFTEATGLYLPLGTMKANV